MKPEHVRGLLRVLERREKLRVIDAGKRRIGVAHERLEANAASLDLLVECTLALPATDPAPESEVDNSIGLSEFDPSAKHRAVDGRAGGLRHLDDRRDPPGRGGPTTIGESLELVRVEHVACRVVLNEMGVGVDRSRQNHHAGRVDFEVRYNWL